MTAAELRERITGSELMEWAAFEEENGPIGARRGDMNAALIVATIANVNRKKGARAFTVDDFMPEWSRDRSDADGEKSPEDLLATVRQINAGLGGTDRTAQQDHDDAEEGDS